MITKNGHLRCDSCGRFISKSDGGAVRFTRYGSSTDYEPLEEEHECGGCVSRWTNWQRNYCETKTWLAPQRLFPESTITK